MENDSNNQHPSKTSEQLLRDAFAPGLSHAAKGHGAHWPCRGRRAQEYSAEWINDHPTWRHTLTDAATGEAFRCEDYRDFRSRFSVEFEVVRILSAADEVDFNNVGMHWSWELQHWHPWQGKPVRPPFLKEPLPSRKIILIRATLNRDHIDVPESLFQNLVYVFSEKEVVPVAGTTLSVLDVRRLTVDPTTEHLVEGEQLRFPKHVTVLL